MGIKTGECFAFREGRIRSPRAPVLFR